MEQLVMSLLNSDKQSYYEDLSRALYPLYIITFKQLWCMALYFLLRINLIVSINVRFYTRAKIFNSGIFLSQTNSIGA